MFMCSSFDSKTSKWRSFPKEGTQIHYSEFLSPENRKTPSGWLFQLDSDLESFNNLTPQVVLGLVLLLDASRSCWVMGMSQHFVPRGL